MYQPVDDRVVRLPGVPEPDARAPYPAVIAGEHRLRLVYLVARAEPSPFGSFLDAAETAEPGEPIAIVDFLRPYAHFFGPPSDTTLAAHPLAARGLTAYTANEITHSTWLQAMEAMNPVRPLVRPEPFASLHHYVFTFTETTFECAAERLQVLRHPGPMPAALVSAFEILGGADRPPSP
jgi:hypothetical protein